MIRIASLSARLLAAAAYRRTLSIHGRSVRLYSTDGELTTAACRSLAAWERPMPEGQTGAPDVCVVATFSAAGVRFDHDRRPARQYHHPGMGTVLGFECEDGWAVVQPTRGAVLCGSAGELVWLVEDALLALKSDRWPNLTDLALVLLTEILRRGGFFLAHAGGVGRQGRCLLLAGESGSGKTTLAVRKALEGWDFYGDDLVIVGRQPDGAWQVHPYWRPAHLTAATVGMLGLDGRQIGERTVTGKMSCAIEDLCPARRPEPGTVAAICCIEPNQPVKDPQRLDALEALPLLGATFLSGFGGRSAAAELDQLLELLSAVPVYRVSWLTAPGAFDTF